MFQDQHHAGVQLAECLYEELSGRAEFATKSNLLVVGVPRGGAVVAFEVALRFGCPLEVIAVNRVPASKQLARSVVSSDGVIVLPADTVMETVEPRHLEEQRLRLVSQALSEERRYYQLAGHAPGLFKGKTVILVDDFIDSGMTSRAVLSSLRLRGAKHLVVATPVIKERTRDELRFLCDGVISLRSSVTITSLDHYFTKFEQTTDEMVVNVMRSSSAFNRLQKSMEKSGA